MTKKINNKKSTFTGNWSDVNIAGSIYFTVAYDNDLAKKGLVKVKVGISNTDEKAARIHAGSGTTYSGDNYDVAAVVAVDENTWIPCLTGDKLAEGGVLEMEQYLHAVFREYFNKAGGKIGDTKATPFMQCIHRKSELTGRLQQSGKEWFYLPIEMLDLITLSDSQQIEIGGDLWNTCPEVARCIRFAPAYSQVPSFAKSRQVKSRGIMKVNTQRLLPNKASNNNKLKRTPDQCKYDQYCVRQYARDYMVASV